jgi:hypothetical protein
MSGPCEGAFWCFPDSMTQKHPPWGGGGCCTALPCMPVVFAMECSGDFLAVQVGGDCDGVIGAVLTA